jgi:hypothetical protein
MFMSHDVCAKRTDVGEKERRRKKKMTKKKNNHESGGTRGSDRTGILTPNVVNRHSGREQP